MALVSGQWRSQSAEDLWAGGWEPPPGVPVQLLQGVCPWVSPRKPPVAAGL